MTSCNATPAAKAGGTERRACCLADALPVEAYRAQTLMLAHAVRPEWAVMLAALIFGGGGQ